MKQKLSSCCLLLMAMLLAISSSWGQGPNEPTNLVATPTNGGGSISFNAPTETGSALTNYQYSIDGGASWVPFAPAVITSPVVITGLTNGTTYAVKLRAVNSFGFTSDPVSATVNLTPAAPCTPTTSTTTITNCGAYTWNGQTYNASGTYFWEGNNAAGCDSTATLNLTISKPAGTEWTLQTVANPDYIYYSNIAYGNGLFVVVKEDGGTNGAMTSTDGINWTQQTTPDANWTDITYGNGLFVAVTQVGTKRVMTSPDGINWTLQTTPDNGSDNTWYSVTYGNGLFVAVSEYGKSMLSSDGINWTIGVTDITANRWRDVAYGNGIFVATSDFITGTDVVDKVITSTDGVNWTYRSAPISEYWSGISYGNGLFVAVGSGSNGVMTSPDGINWTARNAAQVPNQSWWEDVTFGNGLFVAVSRTGANKVMTSTDGINWTSVNSPSPTGGGWEAVAYGNNRFVAMGANAGADDIMTSIASAACELPCSPTTSITTVTSRGLYGWRGKDYTASGTYKDTLVNAAGCDSIATLNLTILPAITTDTVRIGNQTWTSKNLSISHYRNGDPIPQVTDKETWDNLTTGAWSWYNNDSATYSSYGKLYNWYALNDPRGFAPANYRLPSIVEYNTLRETTDKLVEFAEPGINKWNYEVGATNISGFGVYPLGLRNGTPWASPDFNPNGESVDMWTSTESPFSQDSAIQAQLIFYTDEYALFYDAMVTSKRAGLTVRLLYVPCSNSSSTTTVTSRGLYGWNGVDYTATGTYQKNLVNAAGCDSIATLNLTILPAITADTVRIYNQTWTTKNLNVTRYRNGDVIPQVTDSTTWQNLTTGAWCWYNNDSTNYAKYGKLYNWYAVNDPRGLAPKGYHVPTVNEALELGSNFPDDANELIAPGINIWDAPTSPGTNISGLAIYPAGLRLGTNSSNPDFAENKKIGAFWLADDYESGALVVVFNFNNNSAKYFGSADLYRYQVGIPVRLIKDPCSPTSSDSTVSACSSFSWNGQTLTSSGIYRETLTNAGGCDSIATLNLTINQPTTSSNDVTSCDSYSWNGSKYTQSGTYTFSTTNAAGCDSTATLNLTINLPSSSRDSVVACDSYSWNGQTYNASGTYTWSGTNAAGCDSTATLVLTVKPKLVWYKDVDNDGYGTGDTLMVCDQPTGYRLLKDMTAATGDCDDTNANIRPNSSTAATYATSSVINPAPGTSLKLRKVGGLLGANDTWKWYTSSCGGTLVGTGDSITVAPTVTTTYYVRAEGCTNTNCVSVTVTICGPTGVTSKAANNTICQGSSVEMNVQGSLVGSAKWVWYKNGCGYNESSRSSESSIGIGSSLKVSPSSTTTYFVRSEGGTCGKTICKSITITVNPKPAKPSSISVPSKVCKQATITLVVGDVANATSYNWTVPSGWSIVSGQGTKSVKVKAGNSAADIKVTAVNACGTSDAYTKRISPSTCGTDNLIPTSSVGKKIVGDQLENTGLLNITVYPNPTTNHFSIKNESAFSVRLRMLNVAGQVIESNSNVPSGATVEFGSNYRPGIYMVEAVGNSKKTTKKLIKQ